MGRMLNFFFKSLKGLAVVAGWTDIRKGVVIPLFLEDKAYFAYEMLNDEQRARYDLVKAAMIGQFRPNKLNLKVWEDLRNSVKVDGQSVSDFYYELQYKAQKIGDISDGEIKSIFLIGLPSKLRTEVLAHEPANIAEALQKARLYEAISDMEAQREKREEINLLQEILETREILNSMQKLVGKCREVLGVNYEGGGRYQMKMEKLRAGMESIDKACVDVENAESSFTKDIVSREINNYISFSRDMRVQATIGGVVARIVVDTGAEISLITEDFYIK